MKKSWHQNAKRAPKEARTSRDGVVFDSKGELARWEKLKLWQLAKHIRLLKRQVPYELILPDGTPILTRTGKTMKYTADFGYDEHHCVCELSPCGRTNRCWRPIIEDYKGYRGPIEDFRIAVFEAIYKVKVRITTK